MSRELGTLVIVVLKARNLPDKHSFYKQDVYAQVALQGITKKTPVEAKGGQHPVWDEELRVPIYEGKGKDGMIMKVSCWSKEPRSEDLVGEGELDITETLQTGEFDDWVPLGVNGVMRGDLYLEMTFYAAGPPPALSRRPSKMNPSDRLSRPASVTPSTSSQGSPPLAFAGRPASAADVHLKPQANPVQRLSPRRQEAPLPVLPEEPSASPPPPQALPAILRPGGGKPRHQQSSSVSSIGSVIHENGATPQAQAPDGPPHSPPQTQRESFAPPAFLRPGGGISPRTSPTPVPQPTSYVSDSQIPNLSSTAIGSTPSVTPGLALQQAQQPQRYSSLPQEPPYYSHTPTPVPDAAPSHANGTILPYTPQQSIYYSPPPQEPVYYSHNPAPHTPAPSNGTPYAQSHTLQPPQSPPHNPVHDATPIPTHHPQTQPNSYAPPQTWQGPPPNGYPQLQPSTYAPGPSFPSFSFPAPSVTPFAPSNGGGNYFPPPAAYAHAQRPYPYNYAPPPRDPDLDSHNPRYAKPLPLPDAPASGASTPTAAPASHHQKTKSRDHGGAEERERVLAEQRERAEAERAARREQEERDLELARKLDLELNLEETDDAPAGPAPVRQPSGNSNGDMPGSWYRHRPGS